MNRELVVSRKKAVLVLLGSGQLQRGTSGERKVGGCGRLPAGGRRVEGGARGISPHLNAPTSAAAMTWPAGTTPRQRASETRM